MLEIKVKCTKCSCKYDIYKGELGEGGYAITCNGCGKSKIIPQPIVLAVMEEYDKERYHEFITCSCEGTFTKDALPKCPECGSEEYEKTGGFSLMD